MENRHPSTYALVSFFEYDHLPEGKIRDTSAKVGRLMENILHQFKEDSPELTAGLRKLLEAKDCFVRVAVQEERNKNNG